MFANTPPFRKNLQTCQHENHLVEITNIIFHHFLWVQNMLSFFYPIGSMYGIFTYIHHRNQLNVGKYTIHGSYGYGCTCEHSKSWIFHEHHEILIHKDPLSTANSQGFGSLLTSCSKAFWFTATGIPMTLKKRHKLMSFLQKKWYIQWDSFPSPNQTHNPKFQMAYIKLANYTTSSRRIIYCN